jgi:serine/threonine-protein kinase
MMQIAAGHLLGRYELLVPIAKGGMAQVWAARLKGSRGFHKLVAIKTVLPRALDDQKMERMFLEEAELASQIHHPNVVETLELGEQDGVLYLVMEWVDGEPLSEVIAKAREHGGLPLGVAINLIGQALKGLSAAHTARDENAMPLGLVHRDISPQNVLVTYAGMAKLVDFGIAKATSRASSLTELGEIKGKFAYMAPEQVRGDVVDARTDVFAMGILLYVITCGRHPYKGETPAETISRISSPDGPTPPSKWLPGYPPDLEAVLLKALAPATADRYSSAHEMLIALERALPEAFELSAEIRVAEYVKGLLADRATQRRTTIRMAKEFIERSRGESTSTSSSSFSSLRGIAIEQTPSSASTPAAAAGAGMPSSSGVTPSSNRVPTNTEVVVQKPRAQRRWPVLIGFLAVMTIAGAALVRATTPTGGPATVAAAPAPVAAPPSNHAEQQPQRKADEALDSKGAADAAGNSTADAEATPEPADSDRQRAAQRGWRRAPRAAKRPASATAAAPANAAAASSTPSAEPVREAPSRPASKDGNAWDPGSFGGRQ